MLLRTPAPPPLLAALWCTQILSFKRSLQVYFPAACLRTINNTAKLWIKIDDYLRGQAYNLYLNFEKEKNPRNHHLINISAESLRISPRQTIFYGIPVPFYRSSFTLATRLFLSITITFAQISSSMASHFRRISCTWSWNMCACVNL